MGGGSGEISATNSNNNSNASFQSSSSAIVGPGLAKEATKMMMSPGNPITTTFPAAVPTSSTVPPPPPLPQPGTTTTQTTSITTMSNNNDFAIAQARAGAMGATVAAVAAAVPPPPPTVARSPPGPQPTSGIAVIPPSTPTAASLFPSSSTGGVPAIGVNAIAAPAFVVAAAAPAPNPVPVPAPAPAPASASASAPAPSKPTKGTSSMTQLGETGRENTGRWTNEEHVLFLKGLEMHGKGWKKIAKLIKTRTVVQIRTHAQKYFQKLAKAKKNGHHGDLLGMESSRFGKRVKFTGKRRGLIYGSYLVGVETASAAISPALKAYMPSPQEEIQAAHPQQQQDGQGAQQAAAAAPLSDKDEDAAIERGLYRFLSPVVLDPATRNMDAAEPELLPPNTPGGNKQGGEGDGAESLTGGDPMDEDDDMSHSSSVEPLPRLAKITPEMYTRCGVPEWFKKGGDLDELLTDAASVDWAADNGGDARKTAEQGARILNTNITNSIPPPPPPTINHGSSTNSGSTTTSGTTTAASSTNSITTGSTTTAPRRSKAKNPGTGRRRAAAKTTTVKQEAPADAAAAAAAAAASAAVVEVASASQAQQQQQQQHQQQQQEEGHVDDDDDFADVFHADHGLELKDEGDDHHDLLLDGLHDDDDELSHIVFASGGHGGGGHDHMHSYDAYLEGGEGSGHGLLLLDDLEGGIEF